MTEENVVDLKTGEGTDAQATDTNMIANTKKLRDQVERACKKYKGLREDRRGITERINDLKASVEAQGIPRRVFERAFQDWERSQLDDGADRLHEDRRAEAICREALGLKQYELFEATSEG